jgi:hypothetical protein
MKTGYRPNPLERLAFRQQLRNAEILGMLIGAFFRLAFFGIVTLALLKFLLR